MTRNRIPEKWHCIHNAARQLVRLPEGPRPARGAEVCWMGVPLIECPRFQVLIPRAPERSAAKPPSAAIARIATPYQGDTAGEVNDEPLKKTKPTTEQSLPTEP
jgi:hypothetical protein